MTNQELVDLHAYSPADRDELIQAIALFQLSGLPFTPQGAYQMVRGIEPPPFASWYKSWQLPIGFRVFEIGINRTGKPSKRYEVLAVAINNRSMAFDYGTVTGRPSMVRAYWLVNLPDFYTLEELQARQPELALVRHMARVPT